MLRHGASFALTLACGVVLSGTPAGAEEPPAAVPSAPEAATEARLLILGGGTGRGDGAKAEQLWNERLAEQAANPSGIPWVPTSGFPKIVESASVEGLKPGFHVLVLGACQEGPGLLLLEMARQFHPGSYFRNVKWQGELPCPTLAGPWKLESQGIAGGDGGEIRVWKVKYQTYPTLLPDVILEARSDSGALLEVRACDLAKAEKLAALSTSLGCSVQSVKTTDSDVRLVYGCSAPGGTTLSSQEVEERVSLAGGKLKESWKKGKYRPGEFD